MAEPEQDSSFEIDGQSRSKWTISWRSGAVVRLVTRRLCPDHGQLGSNANVADGGIRKGTRSDETRPIPPWPHPPLRPKRVASGVAGLRSGSGPGDARHALLPKPLANNTP